MPTTRQLLQEWRLGPAWAPTLEGELRTAGVPRDGRQWHADAAAGWVRLTLARSDFLTARDYRMVAMRLAGFSPAVIKARAHANLEGDQLSRTALAVALRYSHDVAPMRPRRAGHRLVLHALPNKVGVPDLVRRSVEQAWLAGEPPEQIAARTGLGPTYLARALEGLPPRLTTGDVSDRFGWSAANIFQKLARGTFPTEDGRYGVNGQLRWWWPATVEEWENTRPLVQCPRCPAKVLRLRSHLRAHIRPDSAARDNWH
ncbi:hypothetical protein GCM10027517_12140 [Phycicoccus ginsengisoli]